MAPPHHQTRILSSKILTDVLTSSFCMTSHNITRQTRANSIKRSNVQQIPRTAPQIPQHMFPGPRRYLQFLPIPMIALIIDNVAQNRGTTVALIAPSQQQTVTKRVHYVQCGRIWWHQHLQTVHDFIASILIFDAARIIRVVHTLDVFDHQGGIR